jgi:hypothetical protein
MFTLGEPVLIYDDITFDVETSFALTSKLATLLANLSFQWFSAFPHFRLST